MGSRFDFDLRTRTITRRSRNGVVSAPIPPGVWDHATNIERFGLSPGVDELSVGLPHGEEATVELRGNRSVAELRAGRPVVYLDQNKWSLIAAWKFGLRGVPAAEARAAELLMDLVASGELLLPVSAAHLVETTPLYGSLRVALASTVLQLGRGWQMANPLHVRVAEVAGALRGAAPVATDVFAPQADAFFAYKPRGSAEGLEPEWEVLAQALPGVLGLYDTVLDASPIPDPGGVAELAARAWANKHAALAAKLRAERADPDMVRRAVHAYLLIDLADDLFYIDRELQLGAEEVIRQLTVPSDPVSRMPFLCQMRQLLYARIRNSGQKWQANDLIDTLFLSCAAGYADVVVGEKTAVGYLRQAKQPSASAALATSLEDAVGLLPANTTAER